MNNKAINEFDFRTICNNNYSPKWRWLVVSIDRAAKQQGKYPPLGTFTSVNNCHLVYTKTVR